MRQVCDCVFVFVLSLGVQCEGHVCDMDEAQILMSV